MQKTGISVLVAVSLLLLSDVSSATGEGHDPDGESGIHQGRHLLQLGATSVDAFDGEYAVLATNYTFSYSGQLRFSIGTEFLWLDSEPPDGDSSQSNGLGDTFLSVQYDPGARLTSSPWVPDSLGLFGELLLPTGDAAEGLGGDAYAAKIGLGWPLPLSDRFLTLPIVAYTRTFKHGDLALEFDEIGAGFSLVWNSPFGAWFALEPFVTRDFIDDRTHTLIAIAIGKSFSNGLGMQLHWGEKRRVESFALRNDEILLLSFSWQYGDPPRGY